MTVTKKTGNDTVEIHALKQGRITLRMIGQTPLYFNSMSAKSKRDLLIGGGKKTAAQKKEIKHDPEQEFQDSVYTQSKGDTLLCFPAAGVKQAMATAALETGGITKSSVQRLIFLPQSHINIWGKPYLKMDVVRSADMNKTPDVRTRAFLPEWCAEVEIRFVTPTLGGMGITSLLQNAGTICGIGDFRQEKGKGGYGTWTVCSAEEMEKFQDIWDEITKEGRDVQEVAMQQPVCFDEETSNLMQLLQEERLRRAA